MKKKDFPIEVISNLNQLKSSISDDIIIELNRSSLLRFKDKDPNSNFFYQIQNYRLNKETFTYTVHRAPHNDKTIEDRSYSFTFNELLKDFENWKNIIKHYNEIPFFADDEILNRYAYEFYEMAKILEDDADTSPFDIKRQLLLDQYIDHSLEIINQYQEENEDIDLTDIREIANEIKDNQTRLSKNETIKLLSKFWATAREQGIPFFKRFVSEFAQEFLVKVGIKLLLGP